MTRVLTTVPFDLPPLRADPPAGWPADVDVLDRRQFSRTALLRRLVASRRRYDAILLNASGRFDQIAAACIIRTPRHAPIVLSDCTWDPGRSVVDRLGCRAGFRLLDDARTTFCVLSTAELQLFPDTWNVDPRRVVFTPFCHTLSTAQLAASTSDEIGVFAGGDSMRDYGPLIEAAKRVPVTFTIAARSACAESAPLPSTVRVGAVSPAEFVGQMRRASVIVVPLRKGICRSAGQQTYLNAMALGKLAVVTDSPGVRDYIVDGVTGLIVSPGDPDALTDVLRWVFDARNAAAVAQIRQRGQDDARVKFSPMAHVNSLLRVVEHAVAAVHRLAA